MIIHGQIDQKPDAITQFRPRMLIKRMCGIGEENKVLDPRTQVL
jgi:hypothetical protein